LQPQVDSSDTVELPSLGDYSQWWGTGVLGLGKTVDLQDDGFGAQRDGKLNWGQTQDRLGPGAIDFGEQPLAGSLVSGSVQHGQNQVARHAHQFPSDCHILCAFAFTA